MATSYWQKLKDPRWQKRRLEALSARDFACEVCYDGESTLHVHHKQYFKGRDPWEYEINQLSVLCESCHEAQHACDDKLSVVTSFLPLDGPCSRQSVAALVAGYSGEAIPDENANACEFLSGVLAANLFSHLRAHQLAELAALAKLSESDGAGMFQALIEYAQSKRGA